MAALGCTASGSGTRASHEPPAVPPVRLKATHRCPEPSRLPLAQRYHGWKFLTLDLVDYSRPSQPLEPGRYVVSLRGDCYESSARFTLPRPEDFRRHGLIDWPVTLEGDDLDLVVHETNVVSILVPERLVSVAVRIVRDGTVVFHRPVTRATLCPPTEIPGKSENEQPGHAPRLCVYARDEDERVLLCPEGQAQLLFDFGEDEVRWESGRTYELELVQDGVTTTCAFRVPLPMPAPKRQDDAGQPRSSTFSGIDREPALPGCPIFMDDVREPRGVILTGRPESVTVRVRSGGASRFEGSAALEYSDTINYCSSGADIELQAVDRDE